MKRFIETEIWKAAWFRKLTPTQKACYFYMVSQCDHAGIFEVDIETLEYFIGDKVGDPHNFFNDDFAVIKINESKWFLIDFLKLQYPKGLESEKPAIVSVKRRLEELDLLIMISERLGNDYVMIKDKDKREVQDKREDKSREITLDTVSDIEENFSNISLSENELEKLKKDFGEKKSCELIEKLSLIKIEFEVDVNISDYDLIIANAKKEYAD